MAILRVLKYPHKILKTKAENVPRITEADRKLVKDMIETMYAENGVGLAANQVGVLKQIFVASADQKRGSEMVFFNPVILKRQGTIKEFEGCLSVPEFYEPVKRAKKVWMQAMDLDSKMVEVKAEGLLSRIFQHEIDHLNGLIFVDRLGLIKKTRLKKKLTQRARSKA